eukprot:11494870-Prorocentrum_lima.AAC.1
MAEATKAECGRDPMVHGSCSCAQKCGCATGISQELCGCPGQLGQAGPLQGMHEAPWHDVRGHCRDHW